MNQEMQRISTKDVRAAMKRMKTGKAVGPFDIPVIPSLREDSGPFCPIHLLPKPFFVWDSQSEHLNQESGGKSLFWMINDPRGSTKACLND